MDQDMLHRIFEGRRKIVTSCLPKNMQPTGFEGTTLDESTLPDELSRAMIIHMRNRDDIQRLRKIYLGEQNIYLRAKDGKDRFVNNMVCVNYANAFTRQIVGYTYPAGIQLVPMEENVRPGVEKINRFMKSENKNMLDKVMETEQSIWGTHYRAILPDTVMPDECPFEILPLPADDTFVVYSAYDPNLPVYGCTMHPLTPAADGSINSKYVYKIYTNNVCYTYVSDGNCGVQTTDFKGAQPHILGRVPIIEYPNNEFRMGDWEMAIDLFDSINSMSSDCLNDVEQTVLSYLVLLGVAEPTEDQLKLMRKYRVLTLPNPNGCNQDAKFITAQLDGQSAELLRAYFENAVRVVVGIPDRNSSGGGDTGEAINAKNGWREIDTVAKNKAMFTEASERNLLRVALQILSPKYVPEDLSVLDIDISIPRNKNDNLQTKTQAGSEMYQMHMPKTDIVRTMDITTDVEGLVKRWEESEKQALEQQKAATPAPKLPETGSASDGNNPEKDDSPLDNSQNE